MIPDEHLSDAAQHYAGSSSLSLENLAGIALARAYSFIHTNPKGIYIHGSVGAGKSMLMDTFYQTCNTGFANDVVQYDPITMKCMRCDFNEFMLDVHQPIHAYKKEHPRADPIPPVESKGFAALESSSLLLGINELLRQRELIALARLCFQVIVVSYIFRVHLRPG